MAAEDMAAPAPFLNVEGLTIRFGGLTAVGGLDMAVATSTPMGYGHVYAPEHYVDAWVAVTDPKGWSPEGLQRLKEHLIRRSGR